MNIRITLLISVILIITGNSCKHDQQNVNTKIKGSYNNYIGNSFVFPDSIFVLTSEEVSVVTQNEYVKKSYKIISTISSDCPGCIISQVMYWYNFFNHNLELNNVQLIIVYSGNKELLIHLLHELKIDIEIVFDENERIIDVIKNLLNNSAYTFLLDKKNEICLIGDPIGNKEKEMQYLSKLKNLAIVKQ